MAWQTMDTAPKDGTPILVKRLSAVGYPFCIWWAKRWLRTWDGYEHTPTDGDVWHALPTDDRETGHGKVTPAIQVGDTRQADYAHPSHTEMWTGERWVKVSDDTVALAAVLRATRPTLAVGSYRDPGYRQAT